MPREKEKRGKENEPRHGADDTKHGADDKKKTAPSNTKDKFGKVDTVTAPGLDRYTNATIVRQFGNKAIAKDAKGRGLAKNKKISDQELRRLAVLKGRLTNAKQTGAPSYSSERAKTKLSKTKELFQSTTGKERAKARKKVGKGLTDFERIRLQSSGKKGEARKELKETLATTTHKQRMRQRQTAARTNALQKKLPTAGTTGPVTPGGFKPNTPKKKITTKPPVSRT